MRILVVDDNAQIRSTVRRVLVRNMHAEVIEAGDGFSALEQLLRHSCDLVLLDVQMPLMDGIETLRAIRRSPTQGSLPVVMLTGAADEMLVRRALKLGVADYMVKPFVPEQLQGRLEIALARRAATRPSESRPVAMACAS